MMDPPVHLPPAQARAWVHIYTSTLTAPIVENAPQAEALAFAERMADVFIRSLPGHWASQLRGQDGSTPQSDEHRPPQLPAL